MQPKKCTISYCGVEEPQNIDEIDFEILGLEHAIEKIKSKIALLKQSRYIALYAINNNFKYKDNGEEYEFDFNKNIEKKGNRKENKFDK